MPSSRPSRLKAPAYLSPSKPVPAPGPAIESDEHGGGKGPEPTRFGDWERGGICRDF